MNKTYLFIRAIKPGNTDGIISRVTPIDIPGKTVDSYAVRNANARVNNHRLIATIEARA